MEVTPFTEEEVLALIADGVALMHPPARALWSLIRVRPMKWQLPSWADEVGGFWVVGVIGQKVLWYNEIEEGFNISHYDVPGVIAEYWCSQDELQHSVYQLLEKIESGDSAC